MKKGNVDINYVCCRVGVVKAASYAASWTMSKASTEIYWKLYHVSIQTFLNVPHSTLFLFIRLLMPALRERTVIRATRVQTVSRESDSLTIANCDVCVTHVCV